MPGFRLLWCYEPLLKFWWGCSGYKKWVAVAAAILVFSLTQTEQLLNSRSADNCLLSPAYATYNCQSIGRIFIMPEVQHIMMRPKTWTLPSHLSSQFDISYHAIFIKSSFIPYLILYQRVSYCLDIVLQLLVVKQLYKPLMFFRYAHKLSLCLMCS